MFHRDKPTQSKRFTHEQSEDYDQRCIQLDNLEDLTIEELTRELVNLYGQIPPAPQANPGVDLPPK